MSIADAGRILAAARERRDSLTPRDAALAAHVPGGPSVADLEHAITTARQAA
jgi:hypothetical protein